LLCLLGLAVGWSGAGLAAQDAPVQQDEPIHTLHVYTNLIQIPTLVLGPNRERLVKPIAEGRFSISIDNGPLFRATHVRKEGDDPISLSILLDVSGDGAELMPKISDAIAALAPFSLHPRDHVSIYALDCSLVQSLNDVPAEGGQLKGGVEKALESWRLRKQNKKEPKCRQSVHLWDALAHITNELYKLPGRRVVLAVSQGDDKGSAHRWNEVRFYAQSLGVAVFGLSYLPKYAGAMGQMYPHWSSEDPFRSLCELSGGLLTQTDPWSLDDVLKDFVTKLRERYIVEFPRPANSEPGELGMEVKIAKGDYFIRPAGISVPIPDPALLADPTTVPSDPSLTPEVGERKTMKKPK
jgi:hypothetical protein